MPAGLSISQSVLLLDFRQSALSPAGSTGDSPPMSVESPGGGASAVWRVAINAQRIENNTNFISISRKNPANRGGPRRVPCINQLVFLTPHDSNLARDGSRRPPCPVVDNSRHRLAKRRFCLFIYRRYIVIFGSNWKSPQIRVRRLGFDTNPGRNTKFQHSGDYDL